MEIFPQQPEQPQFLEELPQETINAIEEITGEGTGKEIWSKYREFAKKFMQEPYNQYISKQGLFIGIWDFTTSFKPEVGIHYCLRKELPSNLEIPTEWHGLPVRFGGFLENETSETHK